MIDMSQYKQPVHRSLLPREMIAGVPQAGLFIIFIFSLVFIYGFRFYFMIVPIALGYFIMRHLTSKDQWFIDSSLSNIMQKDIYLP
jgi:type IV secretory pathway VirB3-like protein